MLPKPSTVIKAKLQEVFDLVRTHLLQQNKPSFATLGHDGFPKPAYRGDDGCKCAIGCLIPDDKYTPTIEQLGVFSIRVRAIVFDFVGLSRFNRNVTNKDDQRDMDTVINLLHELQITHDRSQPKIWPELLQAIAERFELAIV